MEDIIMAEFEKTNCKAGHVLMMRNFNQIFRTLNPKQQEEIEPAINNLIDKGFIEYEDGKNGPESLRLTETGFNQLYQNSKSVDELVASIFSEFEKQNSRAGHILMIKNLNFRIVQNLNPVEVDRFDKAIEQLINQGYVTYQDSSPQALKLTEKGYQQLY